jgi:hypothetical protein
MNTLAATHKAIYQRISVLDLRYAKGGMPLERHRALWAGLDEDPGFREILDNPEEPRRLRDSLGADLRECRRLRDTAFRQDDDWVASSIYEALLALCCFLPSGDDFVFRGHLDAAWHLIPSFFRMQPRVSLLLVARMIYGAYRWAERAVGQPLMLTPFQAEAAAQHYGAGTTLLDATESLRVAAYFATTPLRPAGTQAELGAIYVLSVADLKAAGRQVLRSRDMPVALTRVHRTRGAFISGLGYTKGERDPVVQSADDIGEWLNASPYRMNELDEAGLGIEAALLQGQMKESAMIRFRQTADSFEDAGWGVTRKHLGYAGGVEHIDRHEVR